MFNVKLRTVEEKYSIPLLRWIEFIHAFLIEICYRIVYEIRENTFTESQQQQQQQEAE